MLQRSVTICILLSIGFCHGQYAAQRQPPAASTDNGIPAWYHMAKQNRNQPAAQASPSYFEREQNYESRREQPTYERPGIQTNQYANYPSYQNRQTPYENLNALTAASSLNQIQSGRRYPSAPSSIQGQDGYESALKRYHRLLLRQKTTMKPWRKMSTRRPRPSWTKYSKKTGKKYTNTPRSRKLNKQTTTQATITTTNVPTTTEALTTTTTPTTTTTLETTTRMIPKSLKNIYSTIIPIKNKSGEEAQRLKMWKKITITPNPETTTTELASTSTENVANEISTTSTTTLASEITTQTTAESSTPSTTTTTESTTETSSTVDPMIEEVIRPLRPITVGEHNWKPLRFKKPEPTTTTTTTEEPSTRRLSLLEYLLPNTELLAAIKDVVAKFKASLDEAGIDQDVRLMSNQLKNTWQQLRTGTSATGPMNEQLGRLFEQAAADAAQGKYQHKMEKQ